MTKLALPALLLAFARLAAADHRPPHKPPAEAVNACANAKVDDACSFKLHDHEITGTCRASPDDSSQLACRPDRRPHDGSGSNEPPPHRAQ